jgi:hypothetical protein
MSMQWTELDFQRCVDGELSLRERRGFLERIDQSSDGWKLLAQAFLENQTFDSALEDFRQAPSSEPEASAPGASQPKPSNQLLRWTALAATIAAAFWLGHWNGGPVANELAGNGNPKSETEIANLPSSRPTPTFAEDGHQSGNSSLVSAVGGNSTRQPTAVLKLPLSSSDSDTLQIPIYDSDSLVDGDSTIPQWPSPEQSSALSQQGYRVTREQNLLSIPLAGGNTVYVPVEVSGVRYAVQ